MIEFLFIPCAAAVILLVWLHSEAFIEYATLFSGSKFFYIDDFKEKQKKDPTLDWIMYLQLHHNSFFIRLITCPLCLSFWITLSLCAFSDNLIVFPVSYILGMVIYKLTIKLLES